MGAPRAFVPLIPSAHWKGVSILRLGGAVFVLSHSCCLAVIRHLVDRCAQERDKQCLEQAQQDEERQRPRKLHEEERLRRAESTRKKDGEDRGKQDVQDKLGRLFPQHQEPAKSAVHSPWSTAGIRGQNVLENKSSSLPHPPEKRPYLIRPSPGYIINRGHSVRLLFGDSAAVHSVGSLGFV